MNSIDFIPGKVYFFDYGGGYLIRFHSLKGTRIWVSSSLVQESGNYYYYEDGTQWATNDQIGKATRPAMIDEILLLEAEEEKAGHIYIPLKPLYEIY